MYYAVYESPIGSVYITADSEAVTSLGFEKPFVFIGESGESPVITQCLRELDGYFNGALKNFSTPVKFKDTQFRLKVWNVLMTIPFGGTMSYQDVAKAVGNANAVRAVGGANHNNPVSIIVPCHRVIGKNGSLTGYGGGLWRKEWLIGHERKTAGVAIK